MIALAMLALGFILGITVKGLIDAPEFNRISEDNSRMTTEVNVLRLELDKHETWE